MKRYGRQLIRFWRRGTRPLFSGAVLGLLVSWLFVAFVALPAMWPVPVEAQQTTAAADNSKFCFTPAECSADMIKESLCVSGSGCCTDDRCFKPGEGCPSGTDDTETQGKCYAKSPPIELTISLGSTTRVLDVGDYIQAAYRYGIGIVVFLAGVMIMVGGLMYLTAGDSGRISRAKGLIVDSLLGLAVALSAYVILNTINPQLLSLQLPKIPIVKTESFVGCQATQYCYPCGEKYGLTQDYIEALKTSKITDTSSQKDNQACDSKYIVPHSDSKKVVTCTGGGCGCASDGDCSDVNFKCLAVSNNNQPTGTACTKTKPKEGTLGWGCYACTPNKGSCSKNGQDQSCCSGFCNGKACTSGQPGDSCDASVIPIFGNNGNSSCVTGICQTDGDDSCSTGGVGARCDNVSQCKGFKCSSGAWKNFCSPGKIYSWCGKDEQCQAGHKCLTASYKLVFWKSAKMCVPQSVYEEKIDTIDIPVNSIPSQQDEVEIGWTPATLTRDRGLPCYNDADCPAISRELGLSPAADTCAEFFGEKFGVCTDGELGSLCATNTDCSDGLFCVSLGTGTTSRMTDKAPGFCSDGSNGSMCRDQQDCKSKLCNTKGDNFVCVSGMAGSRCSDDGRCASKSLVCEGGAEKGFCVPAKSACPLTSK
jgi:hypothetical protein